MYMVKSVENFSGECFVPPNYFTSKPVLNRVKGTNFPRNSLSRNLFSRMMPSKLAHFAELIFAEDIQNREN